MRLAHEMNQKKDNRPTRRFEAIHEGGNNEWLLLRDIHELKTGKLFRDHCWVRWTWQLAKLKKYSLINFTATINSYPFNQERNGRKRTIWKKELIRICNVKLAEV